MNKEFPKDSHFHVASVIVPTLPHALDRRVRAQFGKGPDERLAFCSARGSEEVESLLVERKLPLGYLPPLGRQSQMGVEHFLFRHLATGVHPLHGGIDLLADVGLVEAVEDFHILHER